MTNLDEVLKSFVVLLQLFEEADGLVVSAAELPVDLLHLLLVLVCELQGSAHIKRSLIDQIKEVTRRK